ncbi:MAG: response regulator [Candidatus Acidiferrum sp.]|jgi:DNA-binding response OmpR family regulator
MHKRAIIVDNEPASCELIEKVLHSVGIDSLVLNRSAEAPGLLREGKFSVAFFGLRMNSPDGPELTRQMRDSSFNRVTPVVMISDDQRPGAMSEGFQAGASFFLYKPIDRESLLRLVRATQGALEHERRRTRRIPLQCPIRLRTGDQEIDGQTIDVSMEGVLVRVLRPIPVGSSVNISLQLSKGTKPVSGAGCVVRVAARNQLGIHLGRLEIAESERLQEFLLPLIPAA